MCVGPPNSEASHKDNPLLPEHALSSLFYLETGLRIPPHVIRSFLALHWKSVAVLAHRIHKEESK